MLLRSFAVLLLFCSRAFAAIDGDCSSNAGVSSDCKSVVFYTGWPFYEYRDYSIKLKRLFDIDLGEWGGDEITNGDTEAASDGRRFCLIAYHERGNQVDRRMEDLQVDFSGPVADGQFVLQPAGGGTSAIPVTLSIKGTSNSAHSSVNANLLTDTPLNLTAAAGKRLCKNNELIISATVNRNDIFALAKTNSYKSSFTLTGRRAVPNSGIPAGDKSVSITFDVSISIVSLVQISGLEDITLNMQSGPVIEDDQDFCVFTFGTTGFEIKGASANGSGQFLLNSSGTTIPYQVTVGSSNGEESNQAVLAEGADFISNSAWQGAKSMLCQSDPENMKVIISIQQTDAATKPTGSYQDVLELTVAPR